MPDPSPGSEAVSAASLIALLDLTRLEDDADDAPTRALCERALAARVRPAAVCVQRRFAAAARELLGNAGDVCLATVANFPAGDAEPRLAALECEQAIALGVDEVDVVFPWRALTMGDEAVAADLVSACRDACGERTLKVILESGMLDDEHLLRRACEIAIHAGADFLKTSTGKAAVGATPAAARTMLQTIHASHRPVGFKVSGGVRTLDDARRYADLVEQILGPAAVTPARFRIGASGLMDALERELDA